MKKIIVSLTLLFSLLTLSAQRLGIQGGYALTNAMPSIDLTEKSISFQKTPTSGFIVGPIFTWDFHKYFGADIAVMAMMRGASMKIKYENQTPIIFKQTTYYIAIPLHVYYRQQIKNVELSLFLGPSFNIGMEGNEHACLDIETRRPLFDSEIDQKKLFGKDNKYKHFEIALDFGVGVEYKNIIFRSSYQLGLNNISNNKGFPYGIESIGTGIKETYRQGTFSLTVGYIFDLLNKKSKTYSK